MAERAAHRGRFLFSSGVNPRYLQACRSYSHAAEYALDVLPDCGGRLDLEAAEAALSAGASGLVVQLPSAFGVLQDYTAAAELCHRHAAPLIVVANPLALALVRTPGEMGADICVPRARALGIPL